MEAYPQILAMRSLLEGSPCGALLLDATSRVCYANPAAIARCPALDQTPTLQVSSPDRAGRVRLVLPSGEFLTGRMAAPGAIWLVEETEPPASSLLSWSEGMILGGVVHELNNPLSVVLSNTLIALDLLSHPSQTDEIEGCLQDVLSSAQRIRALASWLRVLASSSTREPTLLRLDEAASVALRLSAAVLRTRTRSRPLLSPVPPVRADVRALLFLLVQVLLRLADSLPTATSAGQKALLQVRVGQDADGGTVRVTLSAEGASLPASEVDRWRSTLLRWGGCLTTAPGEVSLSFPVAEGPVERITALAAALPARILLVDDEPGIRHSLARALRRHEVITAASVEEAVACVQNAGPFDLIACDLFLATRTGVDLYAWLCQERPDQAHRLILMTGGDALPDADALLHTLPPARCLHKPVTGPELEQVLLQLDLPRSR